MLPATCALWSRGQLGQVVGRCGAPVGGRSPRRRRPNQHQEEAHELTKGEGFGTARVRRGHRPHRSRVRRWQLLVFDPLNSTVGAQIQSYAQSHGVKTISYDRATFQGKDTYYVSFDNVQVGKLIGQGFKSCVQSWNVSKPQVFVLNGGEDTNPNA